MIGKRRKNLYLYDSKAYFFPYMNIHVMKSYTRKVHSYDILQDVYGE